MYYLGPYTMPMVLRCRIRPVRYSVKIGLEFRLCIAFLSQHLRDILPIDEDIGQKSIVDISTMWDDAYGSPAKPLFEP